MRSHVRERRLRRLDRYIAQIATVSDPAAEFYYRKIFSESVAGMRAFRGDLAGLLGRRYADDLLLWEGLRIRTPVRALFFGVAGSTIVIGEHLPTPAGLVGFLAGAAAFAAGRSFCVRRSYRLVEASRRRVPGEDPWSCLNLIHSSTWRRLLRRHIRCLPARIVGPGPRQQEILAHLSLDDPDLIETVAVLGEDFDGTVGELLEAAELLNA